MLDPSLYLEERAIQVGNTGVQPGTATKANYNVGSLPSGNRMSIQMDIIRSHAPGPHVMIIGGVHGDEINGVEIVRRALEQNVFHSIQKGSIIAIPLLNVFGFINFSRDVPDGKDVNRSFPGTLAGSLASRVARIISKNLLPQVDVIIDFHSGAQYRYNFPQIRISKGDAISFELAQAFNPPFILQKGLLRGSLRKTARLANKPCLIYEGGEALRLDGYSIVRGLSGIRRVLHALDMSGGNVDPLKPSVDIYHTSWIRAARAGLFIWTKSSGSRISKGEPLGTIGDPYGAQKFDVLATKDGYIIGHTNSPLVNQGDALFHIGY